MTTSTRTPRADSRRNRGAILEAARALYAETGDDVAMTAIARRAGVAVGTLYNHFPTKVELLDAVVDELVRHVADRAEALGGDVRAGSPAGAAVIEFLQFVLDVSAANQAVKAAARRLGAGAVRGSQDEARATAALEQILTTAAQQGTVRPGVTVQDVYLLVDSAPLGLPKPARDRWLDLITDGIRARTTL